jgi:hypothetical protein
MGDRDHWTRLGGIVKRQRLIVVRSSFGDVACMQQRRPHNAMPNQTRARRRLFLGER